MELALTDLFRARWTDKIHEEWIKNLLKNRPDLAPEQLTKTKDLMNAHVRDSLVTGYEGLIPGLELPDPGDRHVLAAAIRCGAEIIVTFNLGDFPPKSLEPYEIEAIHPDDFIVHLIDISQKAVCKALETQRCRLKNPPKTPEEHLNTLLGQGLPQTVTFLRELCYE